MLFKEKNREKSKNDKMEVKKVVGLLLITFILSSSLAYFLYKSFYKELKIAEIGMDLIVTTRKDTYGVNIDTDALHFGILSVRGRATRYLNMTNNYDYELFAYIVKDDGKLSGIVSISPNFFVLKPHEKKKIKVDVSVPEGFEAGNYTGKINVMIRAPFFRINQIEVDNSLVV